MRLDPGLVPGLRFNPYCDIVNTDLLSEARGDGFPQRVAAMLSQLLQRAGFRRHYRELQDLSQHSELRTRVMETALLMERVGE